jgi:hypothetical protein
MRNKVPAILLSVSLMPSLSVQAQSSTSVLNPAQFIEWSKPGVGEIPARRTKCAILLPTVTLAQINSALASCPSGDAVYLAPGTYSITGTINVPSNVTLRGAGADLTVLNATGSNGGDVVSLGSGSVSYDPVSITGGVTPGSPRIVVGDASGISVGDYLAIADTKDADGEPTPDSEENCNGCDGGWTGTGILERGQIVSVTGVSGTTVTISPGLYGTYTPGAIAVPFRMSATYVGVEDLQVFANNTGYAANFGMSECAYCWVKGVESNYTDGDHVEAYWGYHDEIRDSYFSNAFLHTSGAHDSEIQIALKTSASLVENHIVERTHGSITLTSGAAGNVISYNYTMGEFDSDSINAVLGGIKLRGKHPQLNLLEGNVVTGIDGDPVSVSTSQTAAYRNWVIGTNLICSPISGRGTVNCTGANGHYGIKATHTAEISHLGAYPTFVGNVVGSAQMQFIMDASSPLVQKAAGGDSLRQSDDAGAQGSSSDYGKVKDDDTNTSCVGGTVPCQPADTSSAGFFHGRNNEDGGTITLAEGVTQTLPPSLYLSSKPSWWGSIPFPATGPDITGGTGPGGHSYGNPAQICYFRVMGGSDGGAGGPLTFNAKTCYGTSRPVPQAPTGLAATVHRVVP